MGDLVLQNAAAPLLDAFGNVVSAVNMARRWGPRVLRGVDYARNAYRELTRPANHFDHLFQRGALNANNTSRYNHTTSQQLTARNNRISHKKMEMSAWRAPMRRPMSRRSGVSWGHLKQCVEKKVHDDTLSVQPSSLPSNEATGILSLIESIAQNNTFSGRIGRKIYISNISIQGQFTQDNTGNTGDCATFRWLVVIDKQSNGTTPAVAEVLDTDGAISPMHAFRRLENQARFVILADRKVIVNNTPDQGGESCKNFKFNKSFPRGHHVTYDTDVVSGDSDTIKTGNIWFMCLGGSGTQANNGFVQASTRVRYTD